jgi:hypothetical protein
MPEQTSPQIPSPRKIQRANAIADLRAALLRMTDDDHSMCSVAASRGILCGGFRRYSDNELKDRYDWLVRKNPTASRDELEKMANLWQLARQVLEGVPLACDVQKIEHDTCMGWDEFTNDDLEKYYREIVGEDVNVVS